MAELITLTEPLSGSNCYLLGQEGYCLVIDPGDPHGSALQTLDRLGWTPELVLLTHEHCDHMAGLAALRGRWPQLAVSATALCSANLQSTRMNMSSMMEVYLTFHGRPRVHYPPFCCPAAGHTYSAEYTHHWRGHALRCVPLPGHTPGSAVIFYDEQALFSGDYLLPGEETVLRLPGGSEQDYRAVTLPYLRALPDGLRIYPGHGAAYRLDRERNAGQAQGR